MRESVTSRCSSLSDLGVSNIFSVKINKQHIRSSSHGLAEPGQRLLSG